MRNILKFAESAVSDINLAGGKGANLDVMSRSGFNVPSGFYVITEA